MQVNSNSAMVAGLSGPVVYAKPAAVPPPPHAMAVAPQQTAANPARPQGAQAQTQNAQAPAAPAPQTAAGPNQAAPPAGQQAKAPMPKAPKSVPFPDPDSKLRIATAKRDIAACQCENALHRMLHEGIVGQQTAMLKCEFDDANAWTKAFSGIGSGS